MPSHHPVHTSDAYTSTPNRAPANPLAVHDDPTTSERPSILAALQISFRLLRQAMFRPSVLWPTAYMFCLAATPGASSAMFYFQTVELGFTPKFLGEIQLVAAVSSLVGKFHTCFSLFTIFCLPVHHLLTCTDLQSIIQALSDVLHLPRGKSQGWLFTIDLHKCAFLCGAMRKSG